MRELQRGGVATEEGLQTVVMQRGKRVLSRKDGGWWVPAMFSGARWCTSWMHKFSAPLLLKLFGSIGDR
jgi:hypothetical protein